MRVSSVVRSTPSTFLDRARTDGPEYVFLTRSAFFLTASSMLRSRSRSCRFATSVTAASARISAWVSCRGGSALGLRLGAGRALAASRAASDCAMTSLTPLREDLRRPPSHVEASPWNDPARDESRPRGARGAADFFSRGAAGVLRSGALSAGLRRSRATTTSSESDEDSSSSKSASKTSACSDSDSYCPSSSSSANASWFQNSSSALSSSSRSLFMR